ncbi:MAG: oxidoreductase [Acidobacteriota bacterium]|nr:oxidoreductase [Acidobacteriota bacterium]
MFPQSFAALTAVSADGSVSREVVTLSEADLPADGVLVEVLYSSVNYKDGLATTANGKVARISPLVPGIDLAGVVVSDDGPFPAGTSVLAHGHDLGVSRHGGFAKYARVPGDWLVEMPTGLGARDAMTIGTAGFTAALSVVQLEEHGLEPGHGPVLVTGATGGVGSVAVAILARKGYEIAASTGKADAAEFLKELGASQVLAREELSGEGKPLQSTRWRAAVDCVGGQTLANVLAQVEYGGAVAASGLTGGAALPTTVMPFILRGVSLLGVDSVQTPISRRRHIWSRLGDDLKPASLDRLTREIGLGDLPAALDAILAGQMLGRTVVSLGGA